MLTKRRAECMASEFYDNRMYDDFVFCEQTEEIFFTILNLYFTFYCCTVTAVILERPKIFILVFP